MKETFDTHSLEPTSEKKLYRVCDYYGDWQYYYDEELGYVPAVNHVINVGYNKGYGFMRYLLSVSKEEAERKLAYTGSRGARVHDAIVDLLKGKEITRETKYQDRETLHWTPLELSEWKMLQAFSNWVYEYQPETIALEQSLRPKKNAPFAGTYDWLGTVLMQPEKKGQKRKRKKILIDWKSSSGIWGDYPLQVAAYRKLAGLQCSTGVVRLGTRHKSGFEFKTWTPKEVYRHYKVFESVLHQFSYNEPEYVDRNEELPTSYKLDIPWKM